MEHRYCILTHAYPDILFQKKAMTMCKQRQWTHSKKKQISETHDKYTEVESIEWFKNQTVVGRRDLQFIYSQSPFSHSFETEAQGSNATCLSHRLFPAAHFLKKIYPLVSPYCSPEFCWVNCHIKPSVNLSCSNPFTTSFLRLSLIFVLLSLLLQLLLVGGQGGWGEVVFLFVVLVRLY